ncbi:MerR family transcriptional regulator [Streptomyces fructofermentans]|uniref:MerR family transcriptional regulator n=1 Tax=Streptomyces fructofermentans TaxID=152141 RepID=UPI001E4436FB|nr:MerR family transcriptional regulator [Streptomyces fructofermentans]
MSAHADTESTDVGVTTGFLARKLGVSPTTLRSWDRRYGLGPAVRPDGRHRRWSHGDVEMVQEMCRLTASGVPPAEAARAAKEHARTADTAAPGPTPGPAPTAAPAPADEHSPAARARAAVSATAQVSHSGTGLPLGDVRQECRGLARAAVRLDAAAVQRQLTAVLEAYGPAVAWEEVMMPTLRAVGRKWETSGDRYVEVEHLLSWHIAATLRHSYVRASSSAARPDSSPVLLACLPGEQHTLPIEALTAVLAERGVPALMLGGAVPAEALLASVRRTGPSAVVLWSQSRSTASLALARHVAATRWGMRGARTRSAVLLCGPGWGRSGEAGLLRPTGLRDALRMLPAR